jgi:hypothetical protein
MPPIPGRPPRLWRKATVIFPFSVENGLLVSRSTLVDVEVLGMLAIHPQMYGATGWSITHLPTHCKIIHMPDQPSARDVAEVLWFVASDALSEPAKGLLDLKLLNGNLAWVKPWLGACQGTGTLAKTIQFEGA